MTIRVIVKNEQTTGKSLEVHRVTGEGEAGANVKTLAPGDVLDTHVWSTSYLIVKEKTT